MLKLVILLVTILGLVLAYPQQRQTRQQDSSNNNNILVELLSSTNENNEDGSYHYGYKLSDGTEVEQKGHLKNPGTEQEGIAMEGSYRYVDPAGETIALTYTADDEGFKPEGAHLPTSPPIPEAIARALQIIYKNAKDQVGPERH